MLIILIYRNINDTLIAKLITFVYLCFSDTPCIAKFSDNMWYRCIITYSEKISDTQSIRILLVFVDYGNNEYRDLDVSSK